MYLYRDQDKDPSVSWLRHFFRVDFFGQEVNATGPRSSMLTTMINRIKKQQRTITTKTKTSDYEPVFGSWPLSFECRVYTSRFNFTARR